MESKSFQRALRYQKLDKELSFSGNSQWQDIEKSIKSAFPIPADDEISLSFKDSKGKEVSFSNSDFNDYKDSWLILNPKTTVTITIKPQKKPQVLDNLSFWKESISEASTELQTPPKTNNKSEIPINALEIILDKLLSIPANRELFIREILRQTGQNNLGSEQTSYGIVGNDIPDKLGDFVTKIMKEGIIAESVFFQPGQEESKVDNLRREGVPFGQISDQFNPNTSHNTSLRDQNHVFDLNKSDGSNQIQINSFGTKIEIKQGKIYSVPQDSTNKTQKYQEPENYGVWNPNSQEFDKN